MYTRWCMISSLRTLRYKRWVHNSIIENFDVYKVSAWFHHWEFWCIQGECMISSLRTLMYTRWVYDSIIEYFDVDLPAWILILLTNDRLLVSLTAIQIHVKQGVEWLSKLAMFFATSHSVSSLGFDVSRSSILKVLNRLSPFVHLATCVCVHMSVCVYVLFTTVHCNPGGKDRGCVYGGVWTSNQKRKPPRPRNRAHVYRSTERCPVFQNPSQAKWSTQTPHWNTYR